MFSLDTKRSVEPNKDEDSTIIKSPRCEYDTYGQPNVDNPGVNNQLTTLKVESGRVWDKT